MTSTRDQVFTVIDGERDAQDNEKLGQFSLGEELARVVKCALEGLGGWSNQPFDDVELKALIALRELAVICVRALEHHGPPIRALASVPGIIPHRTFGAVKSGEITSTNAFIRRQEAFTAIDGERDYQDSKKPRQLSLGEEMAEAVKHALLALSDWSNQPFESTELMARVRLRQLGAICVRALEHHGVPVRERVAAPVYPTHDRDAWKAGKTVHTIAFVDEAEKAIRTPDVAITEIADLRDAIGSLMRGETSLQEPQTVDVWLAMLRGRQH